MSEAVMENETPSLLERCKHSATSFVKNGLSGIAVGALVGAAVGGAFVAAASIPFIAAPLGLSLGAAGVAGTILKFATLSAIFGGASHAVLGGIESFVNTGREEEHQHETQPHSKERTKERGHAQERVQEKEVDDMSIPNFRERIERQRTLAANQSQQRY